MRLLLRSLVTTIVGAWMTAAAVSIVWVSQIPCVDGWQGWNPNNSQHNSLQPRWGIPRIGAGQTTLLRLSPQNKNRTEKDSPRPLSPVANGVAGAATNQRDPAVRAFEFCAKLALCSGLLDAVFYVTAPMLRQPFSRLAAADVARELTKTIWKFGFAACFLYVVPIYNNIDVKNTNDDKVLAQLLQTMAIFWRSTAGVLILTAGVDLVSSFAGRDGFLQVAVPAFIAATASGSMWVRAASTRQTNKILRLHDGGTNEHRRPVRFAGHRAIRNMALCTAALLAKGCTAAVHFAVQNKEERTVFGLLGLPHLFVISYFLWILRSKLLNAIAEVTDASFNKSNETADATTMTHLYQAQTKFYSEVASIFKGEIRAKLVVVLVSVLKPQLLPFVHFVKSAIVNFKRQ